MKNAVDRKNAVKTIGALIMTFLIGSSFPVNSQAAVGLSTRFVDVTLEYLQVGVSYNLRQLKRVPYTVKNLSGAEMQIGVEVMTPQANELAKGYEAIPDPTWVQIVPNKFTLAPGQTGYAEIILQIPNDPKYVGRNFHCKLWATTKENEYIMAAGVVSHLKFSAGAAPETLRKSKVKEMMMTLDFELTPEALYLDNIEPGVPFTAKSEGAKPFKVTNRASTELRLGLVSTQWDNRFQLGDYEKGDPSWVSFKSSSMTIDSDTIEKAYPVITIPQDEKYYGKRYAFLIRTELVLGVELEYFNRIYVKVKDKEAKQ